MSLLVGFQVEGWDFLILGAYLAKLLNVSEDDIEADSIDSPGRGWQFVLENVAKSLRRFYGKCARAAVIGVDNDGNLDLLREGGPEDPKRPRHWLHSARGQEALDMCRCCQLHRRVEAARPSLNWLPGKPGHSWPVLIAVPVEMIEAWLLTSLALVSPGQGSMYAENEPRRGQKHQFYGRPEPTRADVQGKALPLVRGMTPEHLSSLRSYSRSFDLFAAQVDKQRAIILGDGDCWEIRG